MKKKSSRSNGFTGILKHLKKKLTSFIYNLSQKTEEKRTLLKAPYEAKITLITKPEKDPTKKEN